MTPDAPRAGVLTRAEAKSEVRPEADALVAQWVVCTALPSELRPIRRALEKAGARFRPHPAWPGFWCATVAGHPVSVGTLGMGRLDVWMWAERWAPCMIAGVVFLGFGGGLAPDLEMGDVCVAGEIRTTADPHWRYRPASKWRDRAGELLAKIGLSGRTGTHLTVDAPICDPRGKATLHRRTGADVADMEASFVAEAAARAGVRLLVLRAVFDPADEILPDLTGLATVQGWRLAARLIALAVSRPTTFGQLPRMGRYANRCSRHLARFVVEWFADLPVQTYAPVSPTLDTLPNPFGSDDDVSLETGDEAGAEAGDDAEAGGV